MWIRDATIHDRLPDLQQADARSALLPLSLRPGAAGVHRRRASATTPSSATSSPPASSASEERVRARARHQRQAALHRLGRNRRSELYDPVVERRVPTQPRHAARSAAKQEGARAAMLNVGPALSPDGRYIAFLSTREHLRHRPLPRRRARPAQIIRKLVSVRSRRALRVAALHRLGRLAGRRTRKRLAFIVFEKGDNYLGIVDVDIAQHRAHARPGHRRHHERRLVAGRPHDRHRRPDHRRQRPLPLRPRHRSRCAA